MVPIVVAAESVAPSVMAVLAIALGSIVFLSGLLIALALFLRNRWDEIAQSGRERDRTS
jgi:hypothetical protein